MNQLIIKNGKQKNLLIINLDQIDNPLDDLKKDVQ